MKPRLQAAGLGIAIALAAIGCAQERPPINRVQPNALDKHFFLGADLQNPGDDPVFYTRGYYANSSLNQQAMFYGTASGVDRIRWEITEDMLIARKAYQLNPGRDDKGIPTSPTNPTPANGTVVAAYKILSHFDIRRSYNPVTGEEMNTIDENTSDRPWYERQYMRVDWSTNEVADPEYIEFLFGKWFGDPKVTPMTYQVTDPTSEDAPYYDLDNGYFDVTNRYFIEPGLMQFDWGAMPSCAVYGLMSGTNVNDCNAQSVNIRLSFWKMPTNDDYEPLENTGAHDDVIHNFGGLGDSLNVQYGPPTSGYDPAYGYTDKGYHQFATVINIWKQSHTDIACNSDADTNNNGIADQCEGYVGSKGSQCDTFSGKCTIPYRDRQIWTRGWFVNKEMPDVYQDTLDASGNPTDRGAVEDVVYSWNQLFKPAVAYAREAECRRTGDGDRKTCHDQYFKPNKVMVSYGSWLIDDPIDETPVFVLCHNPVRSYDVHEACGDTGAKTRTGDLRKFMLLDWPYATMSPFGGVTNLGVDPVTGEAIGNTSLSVYIEQRAQRMLNSLLLAMGDITLDDYMAGGVPDRYAKVLSGPAPEQPLSEAEMQKRIDAINGISLAQAGSTMSLPSGSMAQKLQYTVKQQAALTSDPTLSGAQAVETEQLLSPVRGTPIESDLVDSHWLAGAGFDPTSPIDNTTLDEASPLRGMDAARLEDIRTTMERRFAAGGACFTPVQDAAQVGEIINLPLAKYFMNKYGNLSHDDRVAAISKELRVESFKGVILHEMGHALGMMHEFSSSWDAMNYNPQYWQLRTNEGKATASCQGKPRDVTKDDSCLGPRYLDPETVDEQGYGDEPRPDINYFANTSTMEYQSERFSETSGLGTWDYAMALGVYGRVLETYDPAVVHRDDAAAPIDQKSLATRMWSQLPDQDLVYGVVHADDPSKESQYNNQIFGTSPFLHSEHYTKLARLMNLFDPNRDCRPATDEEKATGKWRVVHGEVCSPFPRDHAAWKDFLSDMNTEAADYMPSWHTRADLPGGDADQVRWSYRIGEEYRWSYMHTNMLDTGADAYEVTVNAIKHFDAAYPDAYFRRAQRQYYPMFIAARTSDDYFDLLRSYHWSIANTNLRYLTFGKSVFDILAADDNWDRSYVMANAEIFSNLARLIMTPQPGDYKLSSTDPAGVYEATQNPSSDSDFVVKVIDGRYVDEDYDFSPSGGGSWDYQNFTKRAGFYSEKAYAFLALCDSRPTLSTISRDNYLDDRGVRLNFRNDMPQAFDRLMGGLLSEDWQSIGLWVPGDTPKGQAASPQEMDLTVTTTAPSRPAGAKILYPNFGYLQQLYASLFSMLYARDNTDMTLIHKMRIWVDGIEGSISDNAFPDPKDQVRFTDPNSGFTYIARRFGTEEIDGRQVDMGIASRMLEHANQLLALSYVVDKDANGNVVLDQYGRPSLVLDANGQPQPLDAADSKKGALVRYVGLIDSIRQLGQILGQGPF